MKFKVMQNSLNDALSIVQRAVSAKSNLPILKCILLEVVNNKLRLIGNDLSMGIEMFIDIEAESQGSITVSSRIFCDIVRKLPNEELNISVNNNVVKIHSNSAVFELACNDSEEFPKIPDLIANQKQFINKDLFIDMIKYTIFATSQDETRPILTGSLIEIENQQMTMVSIDLYRVAIRNAKVTEDINAKVVVPAKTLHEILKILPLSNKNDDLIVVYSDNYIKFIFDNVVIVSRLLEGEFIKYSQIIPKDFKSKVIVDKDLLYYSIDRISLLAKEGKNASIKFTITDDNLKISSNVEIGAAFENIGIKLLGDDIEIGFNPKYWLDVLKVIDTEKIEIELTSSVSPCIIKPHNNSNYTYLVLPVRITH